MNTIALISEVALLCNRAVTARNTGNENEAIEQLVKLRELLNDQSDLKAGGATKTPPPERS
ncbi:unnamed protein product [marine sediment metagenome]|uniref:Uncharacterized protein n=1 Tax=marine sediment metagenome TaxID=412755 RepID=X1RYL0_9ZZZZ